MREKLADALSYIRSEFIADAARAKKRHRPYWLGAVAAVLAVVILISTLGAPTTASAAGLVAAPDYPEMTAFPNFESYNENLAFDVARYEKDMKRWEDSQKKQYDQPEGYADGLSNFFAKGLPAFLSSDSSNSVCSPLNIYMALSMLAEATGGESRQQILDLLGSGSISFLRKQAGHVWNAHYCDDNATSTILANSLWLKEGMSYNARTVETLAENYYASVYQGALGTEEMNQSLRDWLNAQTGGLLKEQAQSLKLAPQTVLALASTVSYRVKWRDEFWEGNNTQEMFHSPGGDTEATFMHRTLFYTPYFWGEDFAASYIQLEDDSKMWLILPDEGKTPADILESGHALDMLLNDPDSCENQKEVNVLLSLPKFDIAADIMMKESLISLGISDVFDPGKADFSPILPEDDAWLDTAEHAARVAIDEEGITAAAYTVMAMVYASAPTGDYVDFTLDRPFLFVITSRDDLPLFAGVVNEP